MNAQRSYASGFVDALALVMITILILAAAVLAGGCAHEVTAPRDVRVRPDQPILPAGPAVERGHVVISVRIVDTDPSDDASLSFVFLGARVVELMRGEGVQP